MPEQLRKAEQGERGVSLLEVAISRAGVVKGARAVEVITTWAMAEAQLGHELGSTYEGEGRASAAVREYAAYWRQSERTSWRQMKRFRDVFPEEESPARLAGWISAAMADRRDRAAAARVAVVIA